MSMVPYQNPYWDGDSRDKRGNSSSVARSIEGKASGRGASSAGTLDIINSLMPVGGSSFEAMSMTRPSLIANANRRLAKAIAEPSRLCQMVNHAFRICVTLLEDYTGDRTAPVTAVDVLGNQAQVDFVACVIDMLTGSKPSLNEVSNAGELYDLVKKLYEMLQRNCLNVMVIAAKGLSARINSTRTADPTIQSKLVIPNMGLNDALAQISETLPPGLSTGAVTLTPIAMLQQVTDSVIEQVCSLAVMLCAAPQQVAGSITLPGPLFTITNGAGLNGVAGGEPTLLPNGFIPTNSTAGGLTTGNLSTYMVQGSTLSSSAYNTSSIAGPEAIAQNIAITNPSGASETAYSVLYEPGNTDNGLTVGNWSGMSLTILGGAALMGIKPSRSAIEAVVSNSKVTTTLSGYVTVNSVATGGVISAYICRVSIQGPTAFTVTSTPMALTCVGGYSMSSTYMLSDSQVSIGGNVGWAVMMANSTQKMTTPSFSQAHLTQLVELGLETATAPTAQLPNAWYQPVGTTQFSIVPSGYSMAKAYTESNHPLPNFGTIDGVMNAALQRNPQAFRVLAAFVGTATSTSINSVSSLCSVIATLSDEFRIELVNLLLTSKVLLRGSPEVRTAVEAILSSR